MSQSNEIIIVYDGECPFCSTYVKFLRLKETFGSVQLVNARDKSPYVDEAKALSFDLNAGMAAKYNGNWYHGDECVHFLALATSPVNTFNKLTLQIFKSPKRAKLLYPWLRAGRNLSLKILGRKKIA